MKRLLPLFAFAALAFTLLGGGGERAAASPSGYCPGERFSDVCVEDWFFTYVMDLTNLGAIAGYPDNTFRPHANITRGQVMKVLVLANNLAAPPPAGYTFADAPPGSPFNLWIEIGYANGLAGGYPCGGQGEPCDSQSRPYFRPNNDVVRGQLTKMLVNARRWSPYTPATPTFRDVPASHPFFPFVEAAVLNGAVDGYACGGAGEPCPGRYFRPQNTTTRAQASKIVISALPPTPTPTGTPPTATRTRTATNTPVPTNTPNVGGPCPILPADNIWNRNIAALPTHVLSDAYINSIGRTRGIHADFGSGLWNGGPIGIPFVYVPGSQALVNIIYTDYGNESDPGPFPIPTNAPIEGGPNATGDRHVLVVNTANCNLYELFYSWPQANGSWEASSGARFDLNSNALRPNGWTSADAAGLPVYPGLVRYDEVATGRITHAIRFTASRTQRAYVWPARHFASNSTDPNLPPMGLRVRLKANKDISGYPPQVRVMLQAFKEYGLILADNGTSWHISGAPDERWDNDMLHSWDDITGNDFEAVDVSPLMIHPDSGQSR
jgi:hypothetical protein